MVDGGGGGGAVGETVLVHESVIATCMHSTKADFDGNGGEVLL